MRPEFFQWVPKNIRIGSKHRVMNVLPATISSLEIHGNLSVVHARVREAIVQVIVIGNRENTDYLREGTPVELLFNESELILGKGECGDLCIPNRFPVTIASIAEGAAFFHVFLDFGGYPVAALLPRCCCEGISLHAGESLRMYLRPGDIFLQSAERKGKRP